MTTVNFGILWFLSVICLSFGYMADYPGPYCAVRPGGCCDNRKDVCSMPISSIVTVFKLINFQAHKFFVLHVSYVFLFFFLIATLCYCDEFCDRAINGDCCPDYESFCLGVTPAPPNITKGCFHNGVWFGKFDPIRDNCNLW